MNRREFVGALGVGGFAGGSYGSTSQTRPAAPESVVFATATELAAHIRSRTLTASQVVEHFLQQIDAHNSSLNAIVTLNARSARQRANEADEALRKGISWGPLHGVPVTLEDAHATAGVRSTWGGFPKFKDYVPQEDGVVAARLRSAGAILLGKTNGPAVFPDSVFPPTNNPWNLKHTSGGSSAGPGAALAAGLTALDVGLDTQGSVVSPAHNCGLYGMRPTDRRVPLTGSLFIDDLRLWRIMTVPGPMARSLDDLELGLRLLSGPDGRDAEVAPVSCVEGKPVDSRALRIAWTPAFPGVPVADDIQAAIRRLAEKLHGMGAAVSERVPDLDVIAQHSLGNELFDLIVGAQEKGGSTLHDYFAALQRRDSYISAWDRFFGEWDVFLCPPALTTARPHDAKEMTINGTTIPLDKLLDLSVSYSLSPVSGCPAIVMPLELDRDGLPTGVLMMGRRWQDERLLQIAKLAAGQTSGFRRPPGY